MLPGPRLLDAPGHAAGGIQSERLPLGQGGGPEFDFLFQRQCRGWKAASVYGTNNELY